MTRHVSGTVTLQSESGLGNIEEDGGHQDLMAAEDARSVERAMDEQEDEEMNLCAARPREPSPELYGPGAGPAILKTSPSNSPSNPPSSTSSKLSARILVKRRRRPTKFYGRVKDRSAAARLRDPQEDAKKKLRGKSKAEASLKVDKAIEPVFLTPDVFYALLDFFPGELFRTDPDVRVKDLVARKNADEAVYREAQIAVKMWHNGDELEEQALGQAIMAVHPTDASRKVETYGAARIGQETYREGDGVLIPGKHNEPWFGIIAYFLEGSSTGTLDVHVQWLSHSRTLNGRFAHARHLVLREMCDTMEASKIVRKLDIVKRKEAGASSSSFFYTSTFNELDKSFSSPPIDNSTARCAAAGLRDCGTCEETLKFDSNHREDDKGNAEPVPYWVKSPSIIDYTRTTYHLLDYVYLRPHPKSVAHWNGAQPFFRLGRLLNVELPSDLKKLDRSTKITIQPLIRLGNLRQLDRHDERNIILTDEKVNVQLEDLCGKWVLKQGGVPSQRAPDEEEDTFWTSLKLSCSDDDEAKKELLRVWSRPPALLRPRPKPKIDLETFLRPLDPDDLLPPCPDCLAEREQCALDEAAAASLLRKNGSHILRAISLYSGIDLMGWGLEQGCSSLKVTTAVESDDEVAAILELNRPDVDLRRTTVAAQVEAAYHEHKSGKTPFDGIDVVIAGPPCQPFSRANQKPDKHDPRLLEIFVALSFVSLANPLLFLCENVRPLAWFSYNDEQGDFLGLFRDLAVTLGYQIRPAILDAASYGSPQHRRRLFCQLAKDGLPLPQTPPPSHSVSTKRLGGFTDDGGVTAYATATERALLQSAPHPPVTVESALGGLDAFEARAGEVSGFMQDSHDLPLKLTPRPPQKINELVNFYRRLWLDELSGTITTRLRIDGRLGAVLHPQQNRPLSLRETARIQGVPASYRLIDYNGGPTTSAQVALGFKVVGNGVAVPTASAIGREWSKMLNPIIRAVSGHLGDGQSAFDYVKTQLERGHRFDSPATEVEAIDMPDHLLELVLANLGSASPSISELSLEEEEFEGGGEGPHSEGGTDAGVAEESLDAEEDDEDDEIIIL
ncbi:hypothetical protein JCM1840_002667 [Sporobolomyces johnsonii]